jgi:hypothetical protein
MTERVKTMINTVDAGPPWPGTQNMSVLTSSPVLLAKLLVPLFKGTWPRDRFFDVLKHTSVWLRSHNY